MNTDKIIHEGIITGISHDTILVSIIAQSACNACNAKGFCNVSGEGEKIIEVKKSPENEHKQGDRVLVTMQRSMGFKAVLFGYFFPFVLMMSTLIITQQITENEAFAGLAAIMVLIPYYSILYIFRQKIKTVFEFNIEST